MIFILNEGNNSGESVGTTENGVRGCEVVTDRDSDQIECSREASVLRKEELHVKPPGPRSSVVGRRWGSGPGRASWPDASSSQDMLDRGYTKGT